MKKLLFVLLSVSLGLNLYLINVEVLVTDDMDYGADDLLIEDVKINDQISLAQSAIKKNAGCENTAKGIQEDFTNKETVVKDAVVKAGVKKEGLTLSHEDLQKQWFEESNDYFRDVLRLAPEQMAAYYELKVRREEEWDKYLRPKMERNQTLYGKEATLMLTSDDMIVMGKLNEKFAKLLTGTFGEESYLDYKSYIEEYNRRSYAENNGAFHIEF